MKPSAITADKIEESGSPPEPGYDAWKRRKIERAKAQAEDCGSLAPAEQVWRDLGLERYFTPEARSDLTAIRDWISQDDERAADRVLSRIRQAALMLGQFPMMGRLGLAEGTREFR